MAKKLVRHPYHNSLPKRFLDIALSFFGVILLSPLFVIIAILIKFTSPGPAFFKQRRVGKNGKDFSLIKFRTMELGAENEIKKLSNLNEADGPVFKIYNDPRYTKFGKILARTGLDELSQLINVVKGEMSLVGPRPLPIYEAEKLTKAQKVRELVKPGITSSWIVDGAHNLKFVKWMKLDRDYVRDADFGKDIQILIKTTELILRQILKQML